LTWSDKIGLIAGKHMLLLNNVYLHFCVDYKNSVSFSEITINFHISDEKVIYNRNINGLMTLFPEVLQILQKVWSIHDYLVLLVDFV